MKKSLILFGDSLLGRLGRVPIEILESNIDDITIYNCAAGGLNTRHGIERVDLISKLSPDYVLLSFGTNDGAPWKDEIISPPDFEANLQKIINSFNNSKLLIIPLEPAIHITGVNRANSVNESLKPYRAILDRLIFDNQLISLQIPEFSKDLTLREEDGIHFSPKGYELLANKIIVAISNN